MSGVSQHMDLKLFGREIIFEDLLSHHRALR